jgi:hypothetical protein
MKLSLILFLLFAIPAEAAQSGKVITERAPIREFPDSGAPKLKEARKGETLTVSNLPTEGFFKVRIGKDEYGWISGNDLLVEGVAAPVVAPMDLPREEPAGDPSGLSPGTPASVDPADEFWGHKTRILLGMGVHDLSYGGLSENFIGANDLNLGSHFSLEIQRKIFYLLYGSIRADLMSAETGEQQISDTTLQRIRSHALPVQIGILFHPIHARKFRLGLGLYVGGSFLTYTEVEQTVSGDTNSVRYSSIDPVGTAVLQGTYGFGNRLGIFGELAYRYHVTGTLDSSSVLDSNNPVPAFKLNYSGILLKGGLEFRF